MLTRLKSWFYDLPILKKLLILLIFCSLFPLSIISAYSYLSARKQLLDQAYENMDHTNRQINNNINNQLETFLQISGMIYTNSTLKSYLTQDYEKDIDFVEAYDYINDLFYGLMAANGNIEEVSVYVTNNTIPTDGTFIKYLYDETFTPDWVRALDTSYGNVVYSEITYNTLGERIFTMARIMNFGSLNYPYGVLTLSIKENFIYSMIRQESQEKEIYILNEKGNILSAKNKSLLSQNIEKVIGYSLPENAHSGHQIINILGQKSLIVYNSMSQGWKTVSVIPLEHLLKDAQKSAARILLVASASCIFALFLIILIAHYFSTRIQNLSRQVSLIQKEEFDTQITIRGNDEIGQLSHAFNLMTKRLNLLINELYKKEISQRDAELYALQSQINPHFLYNTLSVISSLAIRKGDSEISSIISHLSAFYKTSLNKGKRYISIENELDITKHYIAIQHMRFGNQFQEIYDIDEELYPCRTLKLILQPFIENSINHAIYDPQKVLHISIRLYHVEETIFFEVEDDGAGISDRQLTKLTMSPDAGYGIYNVNERIQLAYGKNYGVSITSRIGSGTKVQIRIPI